ncbi:MAG: hypothetical protein AB8G99_10245, partial [Planctomycetaceae bacterium]
MLRNNENKNEDKNQVSTLLTLAAGLVAMLVFAPNAVAQDCKDGVCRIRRPSAEDAQYRFELSQPRLGEGQARLGSGQAQYDYPTFSKDRFPEFEYLRGESSPRYRETRPRSRDSFDSLSSDGFRAPARSTRDREWRGYRDEMDRGDRRRNERPSREFYYSGYDNSGARRTRPVDRLRSGDDLRRLRGQLDEYHQERREPADRYNSDRPYLELDRRPDLQRQERRYEPLPAPRPQRRESNEPTLDQKITARYSDQSVVRFASTVGSTQGLALFLEVSSLIDQRHLSPKSYGERLRNGARNIEVALQNRAFRSAVQLQGSESQLSRFRSELGRLT